MIHLEPLHQSPFRRIDLVRIYLGVPQSQDAYHSRLNYDYICVAISNPRTHQAEVKGLKAHSGRWTKNTQLELLDQLYAQRGATEVRYERASGKKLTWYRHTLRQWKVFKRRPPLDITVISA